MRGGQLRYQPQARSANVIDEDRDAQQMGVRQGYLLNDRAVQHAGREFVRSLPGDHGAVRAEHGGPAAQLAVHDRDETVGPRQRRAKPPQHTRQNFGGDPFRVVHVAGQPPGQVHRVRVGHGQQRHPYPFGQAMGGQHQPARAGQHDADGTARLGSAQQQLSLVAGLLAVGGYDDGVMRDARPAAALRDHDDVADGAVQTALARPRDRAPAQLIQP
jgi:hypothetical protein